MTYRMSIVLVDFPEHIGSPFNERWPTVVPIHSVTRSWLSGARTLSRAQVTLTLAFAMTI